MKIKKIRNFKPKNRYFLAPMEEINDIVFRLLCKKAGCGLIYTGMIHPQTKQRIYLDDKPALQLFCTTTKGVKEFIKKHEKKVSLFDFNLGCPAKNAKKHCFGSFLHEKIEVIEEILKIMRKSTKKPITIKLRKSPQAIKIAKIAEKYCDAICIHPRTQSQGYSGKPDIKFAEKLKSEINLPVIYSGDVDEKNADILLKKFDFVMVGRKAIGNPDIFSKLTDKKSKTTFKDYINLLEKKKYKLPFRQIKFQAMNFTKNQRNAKKLRLKIFATKTIREIKDLIFS